MQLEALATEPPKGLLDMPEHKSLPALRQMFIYSRVRQIINEQRTGTAEQLEAWIAEDIVNRTTECHVKCMRDAIAVAGGIASLLNGLCKLMRRKIAMHDAKPTSPEGRANCVLTLQRAELLLATLGGPTHAV